MTASRQGSATSDFVGSLQDAIQKNPVSAALIGMGIAWMFADGSKITAAAALFPRRRQGDRGRRRKRLASLRGDRGREPTLGRRQRDRWRSRYGFRRGRVCGETVEQPRYLPMPGAPGLFLLPDLRRSAAAFL